MLFLGGRGGQFSGEQFSWGENFWLPVFLGALFLGTFFLEPKYHSDYKKLIAKTVDGNALKTKTASLI